MNELDALKLWVAEYSPNQDATHVEPLGSALTRNLQMIFAGGATSDYLPIGIAETHDGAVGLCDALRKKLDQRNAELSLDEVEAAVA